jgi:hypothetical protein
LFHCAGSFDESHRHEEGDRPDVMPAGRSRVRRGAPA